MLESLQNDSTEESKEAADMLKDILTRIFLFSVKSLPNKRVKKLEQIMRKWSVYAALDGPVINQFSQYTSFNTILVDFFTQNPQI